MLVVPVPFVEAPAVFQRKPEFTESVATLGGTFCLLQGTLRQVKYLATPLLQPQSSQFDHRIESTFCQSTALSERLLYDRLAFRC